MKKESVAVILLISCIALAVIIPWTILKFHKPVIIKEVSLKDEGIVNIHALPCRKIPLRFEKLILDPGHGWDGEKMGSDAGKEYGVLKESILTSKFAFFISKLQPHIWTREVVDPEKEEQLIMSTKERINVIKEQEGAVLSLHIGDYQKNEYYLKAYVNIESEKLEESAVLACNILNSLSDTLIQTEMRLTGAAIIPVYLEVLPENDPKQVLIKDKIAVQLEIGNIKRPKDFKDIIIGDLSEAVSRGVDNAK